MKLSPAIWQAGVLLALSVVSALAVHAWHPRAPALYIVEEPLRDDEVSMAVIREKYHDDVLWLDARPKEQFDAAHVPGALLLNEQHFDEQLLGLLDTLQTNSKPVVVYCSAQKCEASRKVAEKLQQMGLVQKTWILRGGYGAWEAAK